MKIGQPVVALDVYAGTTTTAGAPVDLYTCGTAIQTNQAGAAPAADRPRRR